jgi:polyribonucleotide nucleotidyltransferase
MSYDREHHPHPLALVGASAALAASDIPFNGPIAGLHVGLKDGQFYLDPKNGEGDLDLTIGGKPGAVVMVEAGANFLSEEKMIEAINYSHKLMEPFFTMQDEIRREFGKPKREFTPPAFDKALYAQAKQASWSVLQDLYTMQDKKARNKALDLLGTSLATELNPEGSSAIQTELGKIYEDIKYQYVRDLVLTTKKRIDGRGPEDIRKITCETKVLSRPHGSSLFTRGETQALATVTLGSADDEQYIDTIMSKISQTTRFLLHYNFPPFSVGEARPARAPGRREIGHGALAERALTRALPDPKEFGYTIRLVSEVLESNGSSSMATVCSGTMALYDAGVPITDPIAGIAMGLIIENGKYVVLSDILGDEDHLGDMDFKVCGGSRGITALQMDIKVEGLDSEIMAQALKQANSGRRFILDKMNAAINEPQEISAYAPRIFYLKVEEDRVRDIIGPGGKNIKSIIADTGARINIGDSGVVHIVAPDATSAEAAKSMIRSMVASPELGGIYLGTVVRIVDFGAFVQIKPGTEGLLHISQLAEGRVEKVDDILKEGQEVIVKVIDLDRQGRIKLSRKDALGQKPTH